MSAPATRSDLYPPAALPRLYAIADFGFCGSLPAWRTCIARMADAASEYPSRMAIQVRARDADGDTLATIARAGRRVCGDDAVLILNGPDRLAVDLGYDGVHWPEAAIPEGPSNQTHPHPFFHPHPFPLPLRIAAVHSVAAVRRAERAGVTAAVFAPVFAPGWKSVEATGVEALHEAATATSLPVYALGGIRPERVRACLDAGAHGVAVLSGIAGDPDPVAAAGRYLAALG